MCIFTCFGLQYKSAENKNKRFSCWFVFQFVFKAPTIPTKRSNIFDQHRVGTEEDGFTVKAASLIVAFKWLLMFDRSATPCCAWQMRCWTKMFDRWDKKGNARFLLWRSQWDPDHLVMKITQCLLVVHYVPLRGTFDQWCCWLKTSL